VADRLRALVIDDHPIVVSALTASLTSLGTLDSIDQEHSLGAAIDRLAAGEHYDLIILDLNLEDASGAEAMIRIRELHPDLPLVVFSGDETQATIVTAFEHGVHGYIPKSYPMPLIVNAIRTVLSGDVYVPPQLIASMGLTPQGSAVRDITDSSPMDHLSPRQTQVFQYLLQGMPNKVIGARLGMAEGTVKTHLNTIYRLFGVNSRAKVILKARELGLI
jgi:two-component system, NarL family, nitrate/nitrite response regulator NarL